MGCAAIYSALEERLRYFLVSVKDKPRTPSAERCTPRLPRFLSRSVTAFPKQSRPCVPPTPPGPHPRAPAAATQLSHLLQAPSAPPSPPLRQPQPGRLPGRCRSGAACGGNRAGHVALRCAALRGGGGTGWMSTGGDRRGCGGRGRDSAVRYPLRHDIRQTSPAYGRAGGGCCRLPPPHRGRGERCAAAAAAAMMGSSGPAALVGPAAPRRGRAPPRRHL